MRRNDSQWQSWHLASGEMQTVELDTTALIQYLQDEIIQPAMDEWMIIAIRMHSINLITGFKHEPCQSHIFKQVPLAKHLLTVFTLVSVAILCLSEAQWNCTVARGKSPFADNKVNPISLRHPSLSFSSPGRICGCAAWRRRRWGPDPQVCWPQSIPPPQEDHCAGSHDSEGAVRWRRVTSWWT